MRPRLVNPLNARNPTAARGACFECGGTDHYKEACPRLNRAPRPEGNRPNQAMAVEGGQGRGNNGNQARRRAIMIGGEEARQDPNIVTGTFTLNNDEVTWMAFEGNTRDLGSFGEETDEITDLHQIHEEILFSERGDGVTGIKRRRRDPYSEGVRDLVTASGYGRLNKDLESST
ncbi:hypothetical protein Tco_1363175 [Tanacetum coccineum]